MAEDTSAPPPALTLTRRAFLRSSTVAVGTLAAVTACGGGGGSSAPVGTAPSPAPARGRRQRQRRDPVTRARTSTSAGTTTQRSSHIFNDFRPHENPISEGGRWLNNGGPLWTRVQTVNGLAFGTNGPQNPFNDSYAYLSGFAPNQQAEAVVYVDSGLLGDPHEVELLLRWADSPGNPRAMSVFHSTASSS